MLDMLAAKYHWTLDYILWGVSLTNISMMMADSIVVYCGNNNDNNSIVDSKGSSRQTGMNFSQFMSAMHSIKDKQQNG